MIDAHGPTRPHRVAGLRERRTRADAGGGRRANGSRAIAGVLEGGGVAAGAGRRRRRNRDAFGAADDGEDPFDAVLGLLGMLAVLLGHRPVGIVDDEEVRRVEGWILGRKSTAARAAGGRDREAR
jgi:hypothetical protein